MRIEPGHSPAPRARPIGPRRGFTVVELMLVLLIMSIVAVLGIDAIADFEASQRADRAARESLAVFRYARNLAMTTGKKTKVVVDTSTAQKSFSVYWQSNGSSYDTNPVATGTTGSGTWVLKMDSTRELVGTTLAITATVSYFEYSALGNCTAKTSAGVAVSGTSTVSFTYGGKVKYLDINSVGDPTLR